MASGGAAVLKEELQTWVGPELRASPEHLASLLDEAPGNAFALYALGVLQFCGDDALQQSILKLNIIPHLVDGGCTGQMQTAVTEHSLCIIRHFELYVCSIRALVMQAHKPRPFQCKNLCCLRYYSAALGLAAPVRVKTQRPALFLFAHSRLPGSVLRAGKIPCDYHAAHGLHPALGLQLRSLCYKCKPASRRIQIYLRSPTASLNIGIRFTIPPSICLRDCRAGWVGHMLGCQLYFRYEEMAQDGTLGFQDGSGYTPDVGNQVEVAASEKVDQLIRIFRSPGRSCLGMFKNVAASRVRSNSPSFARELR